MKRESDPDAAVPAVQVSRLAFVEMRSSEPNRLVDYYTNGLGLLPVGQTSSGRTHLAAGGAGFCVVVHEGPSAARTRVGFEIQGSLEEAEAGLRRAGVSVTRQTDADPGISRALVIEEPGGIPLHLFEGQSASGGHEAAGVRPTKIGHVASYALDLAEIQRFYERILGFRWADSIGDFFIFMHCGTDHHAVNFLSVEPGTWLPRAGMHHVAFEATDLSHLRDIVDRLAHAGYRLEWGPGRHGPGHNIFTYHRDPDGNQIEVYTELDQFNLATGEIEPRAWHGDHPRHPRVWEFGPETANNWGPMPPGPDSH